MWNLADALRQADQEGVEDLLDDGEKVTAHFVDSISFEQLDSFLNLEEQVLGELAYEVEERYFAIQRTEKGYDYSFYDEDL